MTADEPKAFSGYIRNVNGTLASLMVLWPAGAEISISLNPPAVV